METFSALLAICAGNSPFTGEFPTQRPVTRSFDVYFDLRPNKRLMKKQSWGWWFVTLSSPLWRHRNVRRWQLLWNTLPMAAGWGCWGTTTVSQKPLQSGPWFNIKMSSYLYRKSHCGDKTVVRSSYHHNWVSYTGKMTSLYWFSPQDAICQYFNENVHKYIRMDMDQWVMVSLWINVSLWIGRFTQSLKTMLLMSGRRYETGHQKSFTFIFLTVGAIEISNGIEISNTGITPLIA